MTEEWPDEIAEPARASDDVLIIDVGGFEGPLDLLLELARKQKVDLRRISVLELSRQYSAFIQQSETIRIELAAEYLVMAAWLVLIKSRLLLPVSDPELASGEELASILAFRLQRLDAMRDAARKLTSRNQLGRDVYARGMPEQLSLVRHAQFRVTVLELMKAYAGLKVGDAYKPYESARTRYMAIEDATKQIVGMLGKTSDWTSLTEFLPRSWAGGEAEIKSATASIFAAALELARVGKLELRQAAAFSPIDIKGGSES